MKYTKQLLCTAIAFGAMSGAAFAEPMKLTDSQMNNVAAGQAVNIVLPINIGVLTQVSPSVSIAVGVLGGSASSSAISFNIGSIHQTITIPRF